MVESIEIYPNPSQGIIQLESSIIFSSLEVFSTKGKQLLIINEPTNKIDLSSIPRGVYILKFKSENATFVRKLILSNSSF